MPAVAGEGEGAAGEGERVGAPAVLGGAREERLRGGGGEGEAPRGGGVVEVRARRAADEIWRAGVAGEASVELRRSTVFGALWWKARQLLRTDFLL